MKKNMNTIQSLNYDRIKEENEESKKTLNKILKMALDNIPREDLIKVLKKRKIIERDWEEKGERYRLKVGGDKK